MNKRELLLSVLSSFSPEEVRRIEELDPQYRALEELHSSVGNNELFFKLVLVNALLSYRLPTKGEKYWENFSRFFSQNPDLSKFEEFLKLYNNRFLEGKLRRLKKVLKAVRKLDKRFLAEFCKNPEGLLDFLSKELRQDRSAKTLVFAVKMFIYACRIAGYTEAKAPQNLDIPLDSRLKKISDSLEFWRNLSEELKIPPLHLDAVVWLTLGGNRDFLNSLEGKLREKILRLREVLKNLSA